jgi:NADPH:quinone reductase-like Zn-dependent oxidoreductase
LRPGLFTAATPEDRIVKAAVHTQYGPPDVVTIKDVAIPEPGVNEIRIRVRATTVNRTDCGNRLAHPFFIRLVLGIFRPKQQVLGLDFAGTVEATGQSVTRFKAGDDVFGMSPRKYGAHAEYLCVPEDSEVELLSSAIEFDKAVVCEGAWYANSTISKTKPGDSILIYGASGAIGTAAVQLAKAKGVDVTAVVGTRHVGLARSLGADRVVNYETEDFTRTKKTYDLVFDSVGKTSYFKCRKLLKPGGAYCATDFGPWASNVLLPLFFRLTFRKPKVSIPLPGDGKALVKLVATLLADGKLHGVFDRSYSLDDIVDAYRYVETEQKTGIVTVRM